MKSQHKICGVVLAAGKSSRMGRDKALLPWPPEARDAGSASGETLLSAVTAALKPQANAVIVVAGRNAEALAPAVAACGALLAVNPDADRGQFSSLQTGLREAVNRGYDAAMITPVDCPPLSAATLELLCAAFEKAMAEGKWAVEPENNGRRGHPLLAGRELIDAILSAPVTSNARSVKNEHREAIVYVPVIELLMSVDMNTPEEYEALSGDQRPGS
ncbi:MAG TPA: nucleotidyltransferase family protein [Terracidiphilus sp.]|nr:nucleotidyltransferase family protein [Terracidiphilus sp.]